MPSPVSELRGPNIKHHEGSFLEDYTFQQSTPYIHALRDPVCNRVTLVGLFVSGSYKGQTNDFQLTLAPVQCRHASVYLIQMNH